MFFLTWLLHFTASPPNCTLKYLHTIKKNIHVAVMGCAVNGPGEAREADLGIAGGVGEALIFKKGVSFAGRKGVISHKKCKFYGKSYSQKQ